MMSDLEVRLAASLAQKVLEEALVRSSNELKRGDAYSTADAYHTLRAAIQVSLENFREPVSLLTVVRDEVG